MRNLLLLLILLLFIYPLGGCNDNFLTENPKDQISDNTFWETEDDAFKALIGCYRTEKRVNGWEGFTGWNVGMLYFDDWTDITTNARFGEVDSYPTNGILPTNSEISVMWNFCYKQIAATNNFLERITEMDLDEDTKTEMQAEARFLRSYSYFWLSQLFGNVPLILKVLNFEEANDVTQEKKSVVEDFIIEEMNEIEVRLPIKRPESEKGRIERGAALAIKGRIFMAKKKWDSAEATFKKIMDLERYTIDPNFKELFTERGDNSSEVILARQYIQGPLFGEAMTNFHAIVGTYGGTSGMNFTGNFVDMFPMKDGKNIKESTLFDIDHPFENRDPRLYATVLLPGFSVVDGEVFNGNPDFIAESGQTGPGVTGYSMNKFWDREYTGNKQQYGGDYILIRYSEILLDYLESVIKSGGVIDQVLLDNTINLLRNRPSVKMEKVSETNEQELMDILKNERAIEFAGEGGIRYWDLIRWEDAADRIGGQIFYGMNVTNDPNHYDGKFNIDENGNIIIREKIFKEHNYLWPIPQNEIDVNRNLIQNPGY